MSFSTRMSSKIESMKMILIFPLIVLLIATNGAIATRAADYMCNYYSRFVYVYERSPFWHPKRPVSYWTSTCGLVETTLIVGGSKAHATEIPHMAVIGFGRPGRMIRNVKWLCGGSLISEKFVLSAAHCIASREYGVATQVLLGTINLKKPADWTRASPIERIIPHPNYIPNSKYHDIALFELARTIRFNEFIRPACLNTNINLTWSTAIASGFGRLSFDHRHMSDNLMRVTLKNINDEDCKRTYPVRRYMREGVIETQFCAGEIGGSKDTCQGDSGGPLQTVLMTPYCMYNIIGVTSFGKFCGFARTPGIYTSVAHYIDWIESIVWP